MVENAVPEMFENPDEQPMTQEEILMNEGDILTRLLELEKEADNPENYRTIRIKRGENTKLVFRVRPVTEKESKTCVKRATPMAKNKNVKPETDWVKYRSWMIYTATVAEDRLKIWDNREAQARMGVMEGWEIIDKVIFAGEKSRIMDIIAEISGFEDNDAEEAAQD